MGSKSLLGPIINAYQQNTFKNLLKKPERAFLIHQN
jgi:hypothetical protein